tara:strand:+ start:50 stop:1558 length:1509 start_codon:yes stop_codon:yes gene_type:complete
MSSYSSSQDQSLAQSNAPTNATASSIPDILKIGTIPTNTAIEIETDVLDPVVGTESLIRFQLQNKGILHSHSKIVLRLDTGANKTDHFPIGVGIHSLIQRCRLLVGTKTISEIDDFSHYMGYKSVFMSGEHQKEREQLTSGRIVSHRLYYADGDNASGGGTSTTSASFIGIDNGYSASNNTSGVVMDAGGDLILQPYMTTSTVATIKGPEYQVALADLFPFLYTNQLPLYMMKEPVTIELFLTTGVGLRVCGDAATRVLDHSATQLIADYQYFPQEIMEAYARANSQMSFSYVDYRLSKRTVSSSGTAGAEVPTGELIINIGGAGRVCSKVIGMLSADGLKNTSLLNNYHSSAPMKDYANATENLRYNGKLTTNIKYNNMFLYPVDIQNTAHLFYQVTQAEGMVPFVTREEYSNQSATMTPVELQGVDQNASDVGLPGRFFYQSFHLNRAERINSRGIEVYVNYDKLRNIGGGATTSYTLRSYVELLKSATLQDGIMVPDFA